MIKSFLILRNFDSWKDKIGSLNLYCHSLYVLLNGNLTMSYLEKILNMGTTIECKTNSSNAHIPKRSSQGSAGYNLWAAEAKVLEPWGRTLIRLNLNIAIPDGYYWRIVARQGLANMSGIIVHNGTIDSDYQGIVCMVLFSVSEEGYLVEVIVCVVLFNLSDEGYLVEIIVCVVLFNVSDEGYLVEVIVCVVLFNVSDEGYLLEVGNCIARLIIERYFTP